MQCILIGFLMDVVEKNFVVLKFYFDFTRIVVKICINVIFTEIVIYLLFSTGQLVHFSKCCIQSLDLNEQTRSIYVWG